MKSNNLEEIESWIETVNKDKDPQSGPYWACDYGLKLDFDGPLVRVNSRFYTVRRKDKKTWEGEVQILLLYTELARKAFKADTKEKLRELVEEYIDTVANTLSAFSKKTIKANESI